MLRIGLLPPSKQLADECDDELLLEIAILSNFDPTYVRSHLVPPKTHAERTEVRRKDGEDDFGGREVMASPAAIDYCKRLSHFKVKAASLTPCLRHRQGAVDVPFFNFCRTSSRSGILNPYFQYFTGEEFFQHAFPHERSNLSPWRKRLGEKLVQQIRGRLTRRYGDGDWMLDDDLPKAAAFHAPSVRLALR